MGKLTKSVVDRAEPRDKSYFVWDSDLAGFGVRIWPTGKKVYVADYRNGEGERKRMTLGPHGKITCEEARKLALSALGEVVKGGDPATERRTRRQSISIAELCDDYTAAADKGLVFGRRGAPKKPATIAVDKCMIEAHIKPLLGKKLAIDLKRADVQKAVTSIVAGKTATASTRSGKLRGRIRRTGGPGAAVRCMETLGAILSWAVGQGTIESNPAVGVKKPAVGKRERRLTPDEFRAFGEALEIAAKSPGQSWQPIAELRLLALTGCRLGEVENLRWSEIDFDAALLRLEDTKTGRSVRPLGQAARDLLASIERAEGNDYVFPAERLHGRPFGGMKRCYRKLFAAAGLDGVTPHVLRHSFASVGADLGFADSTLGACLGHAGSGITSRYIHQLDTVIIAAADKIAGEVERQMTGRAATVLIFPQRNFEAKA